MNELSKDIKESEIDLFQIVKVILSGRKLIIYSAFAFFLFGILIAIISKERYSAAAMLLPSTGDSAGGLGGLSSLAGMAGINLSSMMGQGNGVDPEIYPQITESTPFLLELMNEKVQWKNYNEPLSFLEYCDREDNKKTIGKYLTAYTIGLPATIINSISPATVGIQKDNKNEFGYYELSQREIDLMKNLSTAISVSYDKATGLITLSMSMGEPMAVTQLTQKAIDLLQKYIIQVKTKKVAENLAFLEQRCEEKRLEYEKTQLQLMSFRDSHRDMVKERTDIELQRLNDSFDIISTVYKGLLQQVEQSRIAVKEQTPAFSVITPVVKPIKKDAPKRIKIVISLFFTGIFFGIGLIYFMIFASGYVEKENISFIQNNKLFIKTKQLAGI